jgi:methyl-accepting chemotaxis protein
MSAIVDSARGPRGRLRLTSLGARLAVLIVPVIAIVVIVTTLLSVQMSSSNARDLANSQVEALAGNYANQVDASLGQSKTLGRTIAASMAHYTSGDRDEVSAMLRDILDQNALVLGTYVGFEPDAFDGADSAHVNSAGSDATGRFVPYWNKLSGSVTLDPLLDYTTSDYYLLPGKTLEDAVIEPYEYQGVIMTSFVSPIVRDGRFVGIGGVDMSLAELDKLVMGIKVFDTGYAFAVSNGGTFLSSPTGARVGKVTLAQLSEQTGNPVFAQIEEAIKAGKSGSVETTDPDTGKLVEISWSPISTGGFGLAVVAPVAEMMAATNVMRNLLVGTGLIAVLMLALIVWYLARRLTRPMSEIAAAADLISTGHLDVHLETTSSDEIGQTARAFEGVVTYLRDVAAAAERVAANDLTADFRPRSANDALGNAVATMIKNLRDVVAELQTASRALARTAAEVNTAASQSGNAAGQVAAVIAQVAVGATEQARAASETTAATCPRSSTRSGRVRPKPRARSRSLRSPSTTCPRPSTAPGPRPTR